jgi:hypothetical protein
MTASNQKSSFVRLATRSRRGVVTGAGVVEDALMKGTLERTIWPTARTLCEFRLTAPRPRTGIPAVTGWDSCFTAECTREVPACLTSAAQAVTA